MKPATVSRASSDSRVAFPTLGCLNDLLIVYRRVLQGTNLPHLLLTSSQARMLPPAWSTTQSQPGPEVFELGGNASSEGCKAVHFIRGMQGCSLKAGQAKISPNRQLCEYPNAARKRWRDRAAGHLGCWHSSEQKAEGILPPTPGKEKLSVFGAGYRKKIKFRLSPYQTQGQISFQ